MKHSTALQAMLAASLLTLPGREVQPLKRPKVKDILTDEQQNTKKLKAEQKRLRKLNRNLKNRQKDAITSTR